MSQTIPQQVPLLSLSGMGERELAARLGGSFERFGFAMVQDHGIDEVLIDQGWAAARRLFALPDEVKRRYDARHNGGQRGYTAFGIEIAKDARENDLKEFWHVGRDLAADNPLAGTMPPNVWPDELPEFRTIFNGLFSEFDRVGARLLAAIALYLGLDKGWFEGPTENGNSILRLLHYPPVSADAPSIRAAPHEDINLITLLLGAEEGGLEIKDREGRWLPIVPPPGALALNVGDMLQRLTNHRLPSTSHRVVNPPPERRNRSRYSMPFFLHLRPDFLIEPLQQCIDEAHPPRQAPITAHDYLTERLREIGLVPG